MYLHSFELDELNIINGEDNTLLFDLFEKTICDHLPIKNKIFMVDTDHACRIDNICEKIYGGDNKTEELLVMNNILNPFSVEKGDLLYYTDSYENFNLMYVRDSKLDESNKYKILNINKNKKSKNVGLPPSVNPGLKQLDIDYEQKRITIINKFK